MQENVKDLETRKVEALEKIAETLEKICLNLLRIATK